MKKELAILPIKKTLFKRNNIIRNKINNIDFYDNKLTSDSLKLYNFIYLNLQFNRDKLSTKNNKYSIIFSHNVIKDIIDVKDNNYIATIKNSLSLLKSTTVIMKNFTKEEKIFQEYETSLITSSGDYIDANTKEKCFIVYVDDYLFEEMMKKGKDFTELDLKNIKSLSSSNHIRLYEFLKSYQNMTQTPYLFLDSINEIFMSDFKFLGKAEEIIKRSIVSINKKTDIEVSYIKDKKKKNIQFFIKNKIKPIDKIKQNFAIQKNIEEDRIIEELLVS